MKQITLLNRKYQHWSGLNYLYNIVEVNLRYADSLKAVLEFEPGIFSHYQMRAIRDEYLKLPGIKFGWVTGKRAAEVKFLILNFSPDYAARYFLLL